MLHTHTHTHRGHSLALLFSRLNLTGHERLTFSLLIQLHLNRYSRPPRRFKQNVRFPSNELLHHVTAHSSIFPRRDSHTLMVI